MQVAQKTPSHIDDKRPCLRSGLIVRLVEDEAIVLDQEQHRIHRFNKTAHFIMEQCTGANQVGEIARRTACAFGEDTPKLLPYVESTLSQMKAEGLLVSPSA